MASESSDMESSDQGSDNSDQDSDFYDWRDFVVVRTYINEKDRYDCIPLSWVIFNKETGRGYQGTVEFRFPSLSKLGKGIKFRKNQKPKKTWPIYSGKMLFDTDSKDEAFQRIEYDKEKTRRYYREFGGTYSSTSELDSEEDNASKKQIKKKKQGTKRKQSEQENKNIQAKSKKNSDESEKIEVAKQLHSQCNKFYEDFKATYQKSLSILDNTADYLQKIITAQKTKLPASIQTSQKPDEPTPKGTKWTLRYPEPGPALVELMPNTGVYVSEKGLNLCKIKCNSCTELTRALLEEVFTDEALRKCSYTGQRPRSLNDCTHIVRPGLDLNARQTLVDYVLKYSGERAGWLYGKTEKQDTERIINTIRGKLNDARKKSQ